MRSVHRPNFLPEAPLAQKKESLMGLFFYFVREDELMAIATESTSWILTASGRRFDPLNPDPTAIDIEDIAHALSNICRFTGHTREFYSVAQHSVIVAWHVERTLSLQGLLHDASEAYLCDLARPVKHDPAFENYRRLESRLQGFICERFGLPKVLDRRIDLVDKALLGAEYQSLLRQPNASAQDDEPWAEWIALAQKHCPALHTIRPMHPSDAKKRFLQAFKDFGGK
jgi:uncharacterized protein